MWDCQAHTHSAGTVDANRTWPQNSSCADQLAWQNSAAGLCDLLSWSQEADCPMLQHSFHVFMHMQLLAHSCFNVQEPLQDYLCVDARGLCMKPADESYVHVGITLNM